MNELRPEIDGDEGRSGIGEAGVLVGPTEPEARPDAGSAGHETGGDVIVGATRATVAGVAIGATGADRGCDSGGFGTLGWPNDIPKPVRAARALTGWPLLGLEPGDSWVW